MFDFLIGSSGDLEISANGDIIPTESVVQAVLIRLRWFFAEWRLGPLYGFPYFEEMFVKNPNPIKLKYLLRDLVLGVEGVTKVNSVEIKVDSKMREARVLFSFSVDTETYSEEVKIHA